MTDTTKSENKFADSKWSKAAASIAANAAKTMSSDPLNNSTKVLEQTIAVFRKGSIYLNLLKKLDNKMTPFRRKEAIHILGVNM